MTLSDYHSPQTHHTSRTAQRALHDESMASERKDAVPDFRHIDANIDTRDGGKDKRDVTEADGCRCAQGWGVPAEMAHEDVMHFASALRCSETCHNRATRTFCGAANCSLRRLGVPHCGNECPMDDPAALVVRPAKSAGMGLFVERSVASGTFLVEYRGEVCR